MGSRKPVLVIVVVAFPSPLSSSSFFVPTCADLEAAGFGRVHLPHRPPSRNPSCLSSNMDEQEKNDRGI